MSESIRLDYAYCTAEFLGEGGVSNAELAHWAERLEEVHQQLTRQRLDGVLGFWDLAGQGQIELAPIQAQAQRLAEIADTLVVLGIGGSALGATCVDMALHGALRHAFPPPPGAMRLIVADNPDPIAFGRLLDHLDLSRTAFNVVSKSGSTAETMAQFLVVERRLEEALGPREAERRLVFTTDPEKGNLRLLASRRPITCLEVPPNVGGRYSVLSAVGLLPLACAGVDLEALLAGAGDMAQRCTQSSLLDNPAYLFAVLAVHFLQQGRNILVMMPYASDLFGLAQWFAQLWAESLGKERDLAGNLVHTGQTPVAAVGTTDQHSQLQLYMEGPQDKLICFVTLEDYGRAVEIPRSHTDIEALAYLGGHSLAELMQAEARATAAALASRGRPSLNLRLPRLDAYALGQVLFMLEAATVTAGGLLGVNPLDQPGVELGKRLTYGLMGRPGFEEEAERMKKLAPGDRYLV